jgi:hypothetical protein
MPPKKQTPAPAPADDSRRRPITKPEKEMLIQQQFYKCANLWDTGFIGWVTGCEGYKCPLWRIPGNHGQLDRYDANKKGPLDYLFDVDHKIDLGCGGTNDILNLQILCPSCHSYKTKKTYSCTNDSLVRGISLIEQANGMGKKWMDQSSGGKSFSKIR